MNPDPKYLAEHTPRLEDLFQTRRQFLNRFGMGMGALSLATILGKSFGEAAEPGIAPVHPLASRRAPLSAKARQVVHIFAQGAPSQVDTWDPKPTLTQYDGKSIPGSNGVGY